ECAVAAGDPRCTEAPCLHGLAPAGARGTVPTDSGRASRDALSAQTPGCKDGVRCCGIRLLVGSVRVGQITSGGCGPRRRRSVLMLPSMKRLPVSTAFGSSMSCRSLEVPSSFYSRSAEGEPQLAGA